MSTIGKKRRFPTASSPNESEDDNAEQPSTSASQLSNKRRGSVAADFAAHRLIVSERQQMAVLKQLTAGEDSNTGSQSPSSHTPQARPSKVHRRNEHGETIVHIAAQKGDLKQLRKVLKAGANVNEADNAGWTPLHEAVTKNHFKAARLLLKSGANSNASGLEGQTPLVDAVLNNNTKMAELLLNYSADPSVVDITRLNETMSSVLKRETSVLDSSDNENDDDSTSPLSPLTSDNDFEHEEKQSFHTSLVEQLDQNLAQRTTFAKIQRKKPSGAFGERSSQSSDSSSHSKTRTMSGNNDPSSLTTTAGKNPYDFESEEEGEIRESTNETADDQKKKNVRKSESSKQRAHSGSSIQLSENSIQKKRSAKLDVVKESDQQKFKSKSEEEQFQHIYRVPPLKIVLARAILQKAPDMESFNSSTMDGDINHLTIDTSSPPSLTIPITEEEDEEVGVEDKKLLSVNTPITFSEVDKQVPVPEDTEPSEDNVTENHSPISECPSPQTIVSTLLDAVITQIESNHQENQFSSLPVTEDDQIDVDDDEEDDEEDNDEEEEEQQQQQEEETDEKNVSMKSTKTEKEQSATRSPSARNDLKPTTRTLRSHARGKTGFSPLTQTSSNSSGSIRRVSNRRRALESKLLLAAHEKQKKRRTISERSKKEKDTTSANDDIQSSSNSDDQTMENTTSEKVSNSTANANDDVSSCSSTGAGDGSSTSSSIANVKQVNSNTDLDSLPPNKRRLRERNATIANASISLLATDASNNSSSIPATESSPVETNASREMPVNSIRQFLEIRQQIDKRHETMLHEFVLPKVPKDFSETTMARKSYLIAPAFSSYSSTTPMSIGIKHLTAPHDLDAHLTEVFSKQEEERYKMKLRHQVERDKLILSHEQEVLRLHGNATRSSLNQEIPFSYCSLLKDNDVYNNPSGQLPEKLINNDYTNAELGKRGKHRWNGRSFIKWLEDSNLKYKRLSCELNERQRLEGDTLYSMQKMVWLKHLPKEAANLSSSGRTSYLLTERYLPRVEINPNFWTHCDTSPF